PPRPYAARYERARGVPPVAPGAGHGHPAHPDAHGEGRRGRSRGRARDGGGRLRGEALLPEGARGARARAAATEPARARVRPHDLRRTDDRSGHPPGVGGGQGGASHPQGVRPPARAGRGARTRALARVPPRPGVGLRAVRRGRIADGGRPRSPAPREARRGGPAHPDREKRGLSLRSGCGMTGRGLIHALRSRIALKLTLTLVGFVAVSLIAAGLYLSRALERVAIEVLESRLTVAGRVLHDEAVAAAQPAASAQALQQFMERATR